MRIVALEEHYLFPDLVERIDPAAIVRRGMPAPGSPAAALAPRALLADMGKDRIADMDASGIDMQLLLLTAPGVQVLDRPTAVDDEVLVRVGHAQLACIDVAEHRPDVAHSGETEAIDQPPSIFRSWPVTAFDSSERK